MYFICTINCYTIFTAICLIYISVLGLTAGAHRLWSHASYKANIFLRGFLALAQTLMCQVGFKYFQTLSNCILTLYFQGSLYDWVLEHRLHHAYFNTEKDPFNPNRGFLFAYFTNKLVSSHPDHEKLLKSIDAKDLEQDPIIIWQRR